MQTPYTVPEIARLTGIPETTLYDYVKQFAGIVPEMDATDESGRQRRRYPEQAIAVFQTIRHLKDRGVDLPTIRALLEEGRTQDGGSPEATSLEFTAISGNGVIPQTEIAPAFEAPSQETVEATPETSETGQVSELTDRRIVAPIFGEESRAVDVTVAVVETAAVVESAPEEKTTLIGSPFFEAPTAIELAADEVAAPVESPVALESGPVVEASFLESALASQAAEVTEDLLPQAITNGDAPAVAEPDLLVLRGQLFSSLDEGLRCLHELMDSQHDDSQRLQEELAKQKEENERLRAALAYQQDQARSAERLLAFIKDHCEQGIEAITA